MWEFSEGDTIFLTPMELVPTKDLGSIVHLGIIHPRHYSLTSMCFHINFVFFITLHVF